MWWVVYLYSRLKIYRVFQCKKTILTIDLKSGLQRLHNMNNSPSKKSVQRSRFLKLLIASHSHLKRPTFDGSDFFLHSPTIPMYLFRVSRPLLISSPPQTFLFTGIDRPIPESFKNNPLRPPFSLPPRPPSSPCPASSSSWWARPGSAAPQGRPGWPRAAPARPSSSAQSRRPQPPSRPPGRPQPPGGLSRPRPRPLWFRKYTFLIKKQKSGFGKLCSCTQWNPAP